VTRTVILTGAGISAESGLSTFRDNADGSPAVWAQHSVEEVCTPQALKRNPDLVYEFYRARRGDVAAAQPNAAHYALGRLADALGDRLLVVTQNVDDLHERGGVAGDQLIHMHGQLATAICRLCREPVDAGEYGAPCSTCRYGTLRPDIVFFGEQPRHMERIHHAVANADIFVAIGTSGEVYPAAGLVDHARAGGTYTIELNLNQSGRFDRYLERVATETVPELVNLILG